MKKSISSLLSAVLALFTFSSCAKTNDDPDPTPQPPATTNTYVLVHGAWQAPYVWDVVRTDLESKGNKVIVVELPGHGSDNTPTYKLSLDAYRDKVVDAIATAGSKVILVGHSMGGMVVTSAAEKVPSKISKLVYIGAFIPTSGQSLGELSQMDPDSKLGPEITQSDDKLTLDVKREKLTYLFINDGSQEAKDKVVANYRPEPAIPFGNGITLTANFASVEKVYIKTLQDIVISPGLQDRMIASAGIKTIYPVNTSHSPFLSQPHTVSDLLIKIGK